MIDKFELHLGNCLDVMRAMPDSSVDSIVTDPPYELGFMGKGWDATGIANNPAMWAEALRVLKPGGYLLAFSGSRTYHRMACAIEDAGFEIRDQIMWVYGSGFPKSLDVGKAIDKAAGAEREVIGPRVYADGTTGHWAGGGVYASDSHTEALKASGAGKMETAPATEAAQQWDGWGTALKPAHEPICVARKPLVGTVAANVLAHGVGALNIDGCRVELIGKHGTQGRKALSGHSEAGSSHMVGALNSNVSPPNDAGRWPANLILSYNEDEFALRSDATPEQMRELQEWMNANA